MKRKRMESVYFDPTSLNGASAAELFPTMYETAMSSSGKDVGAEPNVGFRMIDSFEITNFQCFQTVRLNELKRVNIITGANASGKSALMEALLCGVRANLDALLIVNALRGNLGSQPMAFPGIGAAVASGGNIIPFWMNMFYSTNGEAKADEAKIISISYVDSEKTNYEVTMDCSGKKPDGALAIPAGMDGTEPLIIRRVLAKFNGGEKKTSATISVNLQGQITITNQLSSLGPAVVIISSVMAYSESDNVNWFSNLRAQGKTQEIISFIKETFPFIINLEVLALSGSTGLYATLETGGIRKLQMISAGINKIITILLACASAKGGIILIDEIENGIFYEKFEEMWIILYRFAKLFECQLFVSSHSAECLEKLIDVIGDNSNDFSLIRTERVNGSCIARHISGASMKAALKRGGEVRGVSVASKINAHN